VDCTAVHGNVLEVPCRNEDVKEIQRQLDYLTESFGLPVERIKKRHVGATRGGNTQRGRSRSIQGLWDPLWDPTVPCTGKPQHRHPGHG
jgi:hypothetical protein